jgi:hypothetical protein
VYSRLFADYFSLFLGIRVLNSPEIEIPDPGDDPNWQVPYFSSNIEVIIQGVVYYLSTTIRNRDNKVTSEQPSIHRPLYEIDADYAKGCILAKKLLEVLSILLLSSLFYCLRSLPSLMLMTL